VRAEARPSGLPGRPSRESANITREPAVAVPSALANALIVAPRLMASSSPAPTYDFDRSPSGELEPANAATPASPVPNPSVCARITNR
jgi:hypothetical protein